MNRWNWYRVLKALIRRDTANVLLHYIEGVKREGLKADEILRERDPEKWKESQRAVFLHS